MNSLTQTDLQTYLRRLIQEHLPPKKSEPKSGSLDLVLPHKHRAGSKDSAKGKGDHR